MRLRRGGSVFRLGLFSVLASFALLVACEGGGGGGGGGDGDGDGDGDVETAFPTAYSATVHVVQLITADGYQLSEDYNMTVTYGPPAISDRGDGNGTATYTRVGSSIAGSETTEEDYEGGPVHCDYTQPQATMSQSTLVVVAQDGVITFVVSGGFDGTLTKTCDDGQPASESALVTGFEAPIDDCGPVDPVVATSLTELSFNDSVGCEGVNGQLALEVEFTATGSTE